MRILYVTTTFPVYSETFLQREARAFIGSGATLKLISLHKGEAKFEGYPILRFSKWRLLTLLYRLPLAIARRPAELLEGVGKLFAHRPRYWLNFLENLLGCGAAIVMENEIRSFKPDMIHCVWASAPGAFGWTAKRLTELPFSMGAHAYDIFEYGGDWLLREKVMSAKLVHVSTRVAEEQVLKFAEPSKVILARRGLNTFPHFKALRQDRSHLRIACIARLVEKKGFPQQLRIYKSLKDAGVAFEALIVGSGPLREEIERGIDELGLSRDVMLLGKLSEAEVMDQLQWADLLFHTGIVAGSGDRDGLPNVVPEAMASGVIAVGSPVSGVVEAIEDGVTGFLRSPDEPWEWLELCRRLQVDDALCADVRENARGWVEREFCAEHNSGRVLAAMKGASAKIPAGV